MADPTDGESDDFAAMFAQAEAGKPKGKAALSWWPSSLLP
jgi:hypothetical protein